MPNNNKFEDNSCFEGRNTNKVRRMITPMLTDWYGDGSRCRLENIKYLPKTVSVKNTMQSLIGKLIPDYAYVLALLMERWPEIAGENASKYSKPVFLRDGVLYIEVFHPAYLSSMNSFKVKKTLLEKMAVFLNKDCCSEIKFVSAGRYQKPH